jgi:hypothetical protein
MSTAHTRITYDGAALESSTMDVRTLAPALLAFGDLCEEVGHALYGPQVNTRVEVRASFRTGSFGIDLSVAPELLQQLIGLMSGNASTAAANGLAILAAIGATGRGLIGALRWLRNRRITRVEVVPGGRRIVTEDGDRLEVEEETIVLLRSRSVRTHLAAVVEPLNREGIETLAIGADAAPPGVVIERAETPYFAVPPPEDVPLGDQVRPMSFSIVGLSFKEDNKWRLSDGQNTLYVAIADRKFMDEVDRNLVRFAKGDIIVADTRIAQWQGAEGLRTEYTILRVIEHKQGQAQISLPIAPE